METFEFLAMGAAHAAAGGSRRRGASFAVFNRLNSY